MDEKFKDSFWGEVIRQYEAIRKAGFCNMFDRGCVQSVAEHMGFDELARLDRQQYADVLKNYSGLMEFHKID